MAGVFSGWKKAQMWNSKIFRQYLEVNHSFIILFISTAHISFMYGDLL